MDFQKKFIRHYLKKAVNIFDLYVYFYIYLKKYEADVLNIYHEQMKALINYKKMTKKILVKQGKIQLDINYKRDLYELINLGKETTLLVIALFQEIDDYVTLDYHFSGNHADEDTGERIERINPLNSAQTYSLGKVFYRQPSFVENLFPAQYFPRKSALTGSSIEAFQQNLIIVRHDETVDYHVALQEVKCQYIRSKLAEKKGELSIALVPFSSDQEYINIEKKENQFFVQGLNKEAEYIEKLLVIMQKLEEAHVDIVVFPEIVFSGKIMTALRQYLRNNKNRFTFLIGGSIWEKRSNRCELINGNGLKISEQYKLNRYHTTGELETDGNNEGIMIKSADRVINILNIPQLGRITISICADFICNDYFQLLRKYAVNVCFISAFTATLDRFIRYAQILGDDHAGTVFLANCCIPVRAKAWEKNTVPDLLFAYLPVKKQENLLKMKTCPPLCPCHNRKICYLIINFMKGTCIARIIKV